MTSSSDDPLPVGEPVDTARTMEAPHREPLSGRGVSLLPLDPGRDARALYLASHGSREKERLWTYMAYGPFESEAAMRAWLEQQAASTDPLFFTVTSESSRAPIGMASFLAIVPRMRSIELGHIWYGPEFQRSGANTEAVYLMLRDAFERGARRVEWKCDSLNARSRAAALRLGFRFEGLFRKHVIVKGRNRDTAWFSMLDDEWEPARAALERWLSWDGPGRPALAALRAD